MFELFARHDKGNMPKKLLHFFYNNVIAYNVANNDEFKKMFELFARHDIGFKPPSYYEIRVKYLKQQVDSTKLAMEEHKSFWKEVGFTIMMDGWSDKRMSTILNILVKSHKGTIFFKSIDASHFSKTYDKVFKMMNENFEEVDNTTYYKAAKELLMRKMMKLYWTPCATYYIDLML
ncbi:hypothetical protein Lal_00031908 [Lupinus albus]|nr:hypothetical protein Lal_00031908 [Lupinus albus]